MQPEIADCGKVLRRDDCDECFPSTCASIGSLGDNGGIPWPSPQARIARLQDDVSTKEYLS